MKWAESIWAKWALVEADFVFWTRIDVEWLKLHCFRMILTGLRHRPQTLLRQVRHLQDRAAREHYRAGV